MTKPRTVVSHHEPSASRLKTYIAGFILSVALTLAAYELVINHSFSRVILIAVIIGLALVQFAVQLVFFLHIGSESSPRWKFLVFSFMFGVVLILVIGSLWIMNNLNYHMMSPSEQKHYLRTEEGL